MLKNDSDQAVIVKNITKSFRIPLEGTSGIKQKLINILKGRKGYRDFKTLEDVSFSIKKGEFFGIVGRNGSGKSTLLKIIADIYVPQRGSVKVNGSLVPFIELGVGFNPELTGHENIYLNGALLGFSHQEIESMYDEIVDFAELGDFMEERLKNYSSGMQVRLAFSIAIRAKSDILLLDEILAVGDEAFQKKCISYFYNIKKSGQTVILVTHDMTNVERFCDRALVLNDSRAMGIYKPAKAKAIYEQLNRVAVQKDNKKEFKVENKWGTGDVSVSEIKIYDMNILRTDNVVKQGDDIRIEIKLNNKTDPMDIVIGLAFKDLFGTNLSGPNSQSVSLNSAHSVIFDIPKISFVPGTYSLTVAVFNQNSEIEYDHIEEALKLTIISSGREQYGKVALFGKWSQLK